MVVTKKRSKPRYKTQEHRADLLKQNMARRKDQQKKRLAEEKKQDTI